MVDRYKEPTPQGAVIHCGPSDGNDYTLCGYALEGECDSGHGGCEPTVLVTRGKISCEKCLNIIRFAKAIPARFLAREIH